MLPEYVIEYKEYMSLLEKYCFPLGHLEDELLEDDELFFLCLAAILSSRSSSKYSYCNFPFLSKDFPYSRCPSSLKTPSYCNCPLI